MSLLFLLSLPILLSAPPSPEPQADPFTAGISYAIDCGGNTNFTSQLGQQWLADRYFSGGSRGAVADPHLFTQPQERTLRFFPPNSFGQKSCYSVPVPPGRYYVRTFTVYDNYDAKSRTPSFDVSVEGTLVFSWRSPWPESAARSGAYADLFAPVADSAADVCFYSIATDPPVIASLELHAVDPLAYAASALGTDLVLVNYGRLSTGSDVFGPGFTNDSDAFGRVWQSDADFRNPNIKIKALSAGGHGVAGTNRTPNYFPEQLYLTAVTTVDPGDVLEYLLPVDARLNYMLWLHFAEIDVSVTAAGQRVFNVSINGNNVGSVDIFKAVGGFTAFDWHFVVENLTTSPLSVKLAPVAGKPIICGLENYAMVPLDLATLPSQATAMRALKASLRIPDRMGWNGDPCAPSTWNAWEGVTCQHSKDGSGLVVTQLDLGSQGLKGSISDQISLLTNLVSLNLSSNSLGGTLQSGLGQGSLVTLDLSMNQFSGNIPDSLGSTNLQLADLSMNQFSGNIPDSLGSTNLQLALLNNNELDGQVPERLYSIGVHGGIIDLSGNKGLCGVPSLPACPIFWEKGKLSTAGKVAIGLSFVVLLVLLLIVYVLFIRKGPNDYDFAPPSDLTSIAAKRNRYQRQKSAMVLEMETQHSNGFQPAPTHM